MRGHPPHRRGGESASLPEGQFAAFNRADFLFSFALVASGNLLFGVNDLLGPGVLFAFVTGRYYHPRLEERVLFIDLRSSAAIARPRL